MPVMIASVFKSVRIFGRYILKLEVQMTVQRQALRRSRSNRMIAGVCGGLAEFFGVSTFWFRLAFLIAMIPGGIPGILVYLLMVMIVPGE